MHLFLPGYDPGENGAVGTESHVFLPLALSGWTGCVAPAFKDGPLCFLLSSALFCHFVRKSTQGDFKEVSFSTY